MEIFVRIEKDTVVMELLSKRSVLRTDNIVEADNGLSVVVKRETASYDRNLGAILILMLDRLLKDQEIQLNTIKTGKLESYAGEDSTAYKIGQAFLAGLGLSNQA